MITFLLPCPRKGILSRKVSICVRDVFQSRMVYMYYWDTFLCILYCVLFRKGFFIKRAENNVLNVRGIVHMLWVVNILHSALYMTSTTLLSQRWIHTVCYCLAWLVFYLCELRNDIECGTTQERFFIHIKLLCNMCTHTYTGRYSITLLFPGVSNTVYMFFIHDPT